MTTFAPTLRALAVAGLVGAASASAQTPITAGPTFPGGTTLTSTASGITLVLPDDIQAEWDQDLGGLLLGTPDGDYLAALWGWSEGTAEEVEAVIGQRLEAAGVRGEYRGEPEVGESESRALYDVVTGEGPGLMRGVIRVGEPGNVAAVAVLGAADAQATVDSVAERILAGLRFGPPEAGAWRAEVEGTVLTTGSSSSDYSPGGSSGGGSTASQSSTTLQLCRGMQYGYETESETYVSIPGASASSTSRDAHQGAWYIVADLIGTPTLVLEATDGRVFHWSVSEYGNDVIVDGTAYAVAGGC